VYDNNKRYYGQAVSYINGRAHGTEGRWKKHVAEALAGSDRCRALNNAIRKYGETNFAVKTVKICPVNQLDYYECKYIRQGNTMCPNGYNIRSGGSRGRHHPDSIAKLKAAKSGEGNHMFGKHHTDEAKRKISIANTGKQRDEDYRKKMSESKGRKPEYSELPMYVYYVKSRSSE